MVQRNPEDSLSPLDKLLALEEEEEEQPQEEGLTPLQKLQKLEEEEEATNRMNEAFASPPPPPQPHDFERPEAPVAEPAAPSELPSPTVELSPLEKLQRLEADETPELSPIQKLMALEEGEDLSAEAQLLLDMNIAGDARSAEAISGSVMYIDFEPVVERVRGSIETMARSITKDNPEPLRADLQESTEGRWPELFHGGGVWWIRC